MKKKYRKRRMSAKHASKTNNQKRKKKKIFTFAKFITTRTQRILFFFGVKLLSFRFYIYLPALGPAESESESPPAKEGGYETRAILDERARGKREGISRRASSIYLRLSLALSLSLT